MKFLIFINLYIATSLNPFDQGQNETSLERMNK